MIDDTNFINYVLTNYLEGTTIKSFQFIRELNEIVLKNTHYTKLLKYKNKVDIYYSIKLVYDFLKELNPEYAEYFIERLNDETFVFSKEFNIGQSYYIAGSNKRGIEIPITNTIEDAYIILHELMHDINLLNVGSSSRCRMLFTESISMLSEYLFRDFLIKNNLFIKDSYKFMVNSYVAVRQMSTQNDFELKLAEYYIENGFVSVNNLKSLYVNYDIDTIDSCIINLLNYEELQIEHNQRYIIGALFASYMYYRIKNNKKNIQEFMDANSIIDYITFEDILSYFDLTIKEDEEEYVLFTNESLKKLEKVYKKEIKFE